MKALLLFICFITATSSLPAFAQRDKHPLDCHKNLTLSVQSLERTQLALSENKVAVYYVLPADAEYSEEEYAAIRRATREVQAWYQINTGGLTYTFAYPDTVILYRGLENTSHYQQDWWGLLLPEMQAQGEPIWQQGVVASLWIKTGQSGGIGLGLNGCEGYCGVAMAGVENFPEFNDYGVCPTDPEGIMWPCVPHATMAHELGHAFGLPHPIEDEATQEVASHSVMWTHWNYPNHVTEEDRPWGLLTVERVALWSNPFFYKDISLRQIYDADVVNLPVTGPAPRTRFSSSVKGMTVQLRNRTQGAQLYYWTFGDGSVSNETSPSHTFSQPGTYTITLRASSESGMTSVQQTTVTVKGKRNPVSKPILVGPIKIYPNPSTDGRFTISFPPISFPIRLTVHNAMGHPIIDQTLSDTSRDLQLDLNDFGRGVYYFRVEIRRAVFTQRLVIL